MKRYLIGGVGAIVLVFGIGYAGYKLGVEQAATAYQLGHADRVLAEHIAAQYGNEQRIVVDNTNYKRLRELENENATLRTSLANGTIRVRVTATSCVPNGPDASGVDAGTSTAELHPRTAADLAALTARADREAVKLNTLQEWVRTLPNTAP